MAKGKGNRGNKQNRNYFTQQIQKGGENFLNSKTPRDLSNDAERIFRDLVRGNIDVRQYSGFLLNPSLLETLITKAGTQYNYWWGIRTAVDNYIQQMNAMKQSNIPVDSQTELIFGGIINDAIAKFTVYQNLYNCLLCVRENQVVDPLEQLPRVVGNYKYSI